MHGLFAAAVREGSAGRSLDPKAGAEARNIKSRVAELPSEDIPASPNERHSFFRPREMIATSFTWAAQPPRIALRVGAAALIAGSAGALTGLERSYWAAAAAVYSPVGSTMSMRWWAMPRRRSSGSLSVPMSNPR